MNESLFPELETIKDAKERLHETMEAGGDMRCPCCDQYCKVYKRRIHKKMLDALGTLATIGGEFEFKHISAFSEYGTADFPKLRYWKLIEHKQKSANDEGKKDSGYWRITSQGMLFLRDQLAVPEYAHVYNGELLGHSGKAVRAFDVNSGFNYAELMGG